MDFLKDYAFLQRLNKHKVREYWVSIGVLDFQTERLLSRVEGKVISGNMTVAANSPTRRSGSLNIVFDEKLRNITDVQNLIAIDKKVQINIGITNPFYLRNVNNFNTIEENRYSSYGDILWFPQGVFIITKANSSKRANNSQIQINFVDKMAMLNGVCGGMLPASVSFHELLIVDDDGNTSTEYPLISQIIRECVQHFGGEHPSKIIIQDIEDVGRQTLRYQGSTPIRFQTTNGATDTLRRAGGSFIISESQVEGFDDVFYKGDVVGYLETPLTFPGELIKKAGATVTQVLDDIVNALGNFEYFYDVEGNFHFQKKRNYLQTGNVPLNFGVTSYLGEDNQGNPFNIQVNEDSIQKFYLPVFQPDSFLTEFSDDSLAVQINFNPNYDNIKNDFIVWGTRDSKESEANMVRYHLAIDRRPKDYFDDNGDSLSLCNQYIYAVIRPPEQKQLTPEEQKEQNESYASAELSGATTTIANSSNINQDNFEGTIVRYQTSHFLSDEYDGHIVKMVCRPLKLCFPDLPSEYWFNWREELYRLALINYGNSTDVEIATDGASKQLGEHYFEELRAEWRQIFNPESSIQNKGVESFEQKWKDTQGEKYGTPWAGYHPDVVNNPGKVRYWLDIIDSSDEIGKYSIDRIGRRSVIKDNSQINELISNPVNDIVFLDSSNEDWKYKEQVNGQGIQGRIAYYDSIGQTWAILSKNVMPLFETVSSLGTCFDDIRQLLYTNLVYNSSISMTCIPLLYLDVNKVMRLNFPEMGIKGDYVLNQISWNLGATATMNLSLQEALVIN